MHAVLIGEKITAYSDMVRNPDEKRSLTIPTGTWENNVKMGLEQREWMAVDWIRLAQDRDM